MTASPPVIECSPLPPPTSSVTRVLKFEIVFPGMRKKDLFQGNDCLTRRIQGAMKDMTVASNMALSALVQAKLGLIPWPTRVKGEGAARVTTPVPAASAAYQLFSGKWQPWHKPCYEADKGPEVASSVFSEAASRVLTRFKTDMGPIAKGLISMPTFRRVPLGFVARTVQIDDQGHISFPIWKGRHNNRITVKPRRLRKGEREIFRRCISGEYTFGNASLILHDKPGRKSKWFVALQWTGEVARPEGRLVAGVHLGMVTSASVAYMDTGTGKLLKQRDLLQLPDTATRAFNRLSKEKRQRLATNRREAGAREGRGRKRKLRVVRAIGDKAGRVIDTAINQLAASIVGAAKRRGAVGIAIEDLTNWSVNQMLDELPDGTNAQRAARRRWYFQWRQGTTRAAIKSCAQGEGLEVYDISARMDSRTCAACGKVWAKTGVYRPKGDEVPAVEHGRITWHRWSCSCGYQDHADRNAAVVTAQRALKAFQEAREAEYNAKLKAAEKAAGEK